MRTHRTAVAFMLAMLASACASGGGAPESSPAAAGQKVGLVFDIGGRGDKSFNDSAAAGLDRARSELGAQTKDLSPAAGGENREELLRLLTSDGYKLIIAVGFAFTDSVTKVAAEHPGTTYAIVDTVVQAPNVVSLTFAQEQGSYLVGAAAASKSKTGKVGFVGGVGGPVIGSFQAGFEAGAKKVKPNVTILSKYLTQPPDFTGFTDPTKGKEAALGMYADGADIVYHAAGASGIGVFQAAKDASAKGTKVWVIGVDSDQYLSLGDATLQPFVLTSMEKHVSVSVFETIRDFVAGKAVGGQTRVFDLKVNGVGYSTSGGYVDDLKSVLDDLRRQIVDGKITVPTKP